MPEDREAGPGNRARTSFLPAPRVAGAVLFFHSVGIFFAKRVRGCSSLARPRSLRSETPSTATQQRSPGRGPSVSARGRVPDTPFWSASWVPAFSGEMAAGTRQAIEPPTLRLETLKPKPSVRCRELLSVLFENGGGGEIRPAGGRSHRAGACGSRAARPAGGYAGPDRLSCAREGNSEGSHAGLCPAAGGIARGGGSEGWARCPARAIAPSPRGKRKLRAGSACRAPARGWAGSRRTRSPIARCGKGTRTGTCAIATSSRSRW